MSLNGIPRTRPEDVVLEILSTAKRVLVLGSPGSGKTWFARRLAPILGLPLFHMDDLYWEAGWRRPGRSAWNARLEALVEQESWVIDGNYARYLRPRVQRADVAIHLDPGPLQCIRGLAGRTVRLWLGVPDEYRPHAIAASGASIAHGLPHLLRLALRYRSHDAKTLRKEAAAFQLPVLHCSTRLEAADLLSDLRQLKRQRTRTSSESASGRRAE